jgi:hypothetical protein
MQLNQKTQFLLKLTAYLAASKKPVVYIAGKVTGLPVEVYTAKFAQSRWKLQEHYHVLNPVDFISPDTPWEEAMLMSMILLSVSDTICLQPDWQDSRGAKAEWANAVMFNLKFIYE